MRTRVVIYDRTRPGLGYFPWHQSAHDAMGDAHEYLSTHHPNVEEVWVQILNDAGLAALLPGLPLIVAEGKWGAER